LIRESVSGIGMSTLVARTGLMAHEIESYMRGREVVALVNQEPWLVDAAWFRAAKDGLAAGVRKFHQANPLRPGVTKGDLRGNLPAHVLDALLAAAKEIAVEGDMVRLSTHKVVLREEEERARETIERIFEKAGLAVPAVAEALAQSGVELKRARSILQI